MPDLLQRLKTALADRYRIEHELGSGGMATVYLADDLKLHRKVALKVLRPELAAALGPERFLREIEIAANLNHPNILPLHDSGEAEGFLYYVMPYVEGKSLRARLAREKQLPIDDALQIARDVADALGSAHKHDVIHRDIKPENILLEEGKAVVADFGIALAINAAGGERLTETGLSLGTPHYMSPEQATGDRQLTPAADIYSLACVLYEMLAGDPPHNASTTQAIIAKLMTEAPTRLSVLRDSVPPHVEAAVQRALAKVPADRFGSAADFADALAAPSETVPGFEIAGGVVREWRYRSKIVPAVLGVAGLALTAGLGYWVVGGASRADRARDVALPEIERLAEDGDWEAAYGLATQAYAVIPGDATLEALWPSFTRTVNITSNPEGARVHRRAYAAPDSAWEYLGTTPLENVKFPRGYSRLRLELEGYRSLDVARSWRGLNDTFRLYRPDSLPDNVVHVPATEFALDYEAPGLWQTEPVVLQDFFMDRYEVTNQAFKEFIDAGGYQSEEYWDHPFIADAGELSWGEAIAQFVDKTGRQGPSTWEVGDYPDGEGDFPVTGVSWYEAAAYARFVGRDLPTVYHWYLAAATGRGAWILPASNMEGERPAAVGQFLGMSRYGTFDMAGNAREWVYNAKGDQRFILGGGWNDPYYTFSVANAQSPFDRSPTNGFRLATYIGDTTGFARARRAISNPTRDFASETPVTDDIFAIYRRMYAYDAAALNAEITAADTSEDWVRERISFEAAYGSQRMILYLFLPRKAAPPFQATVFFPGSAALTMQSFTQYPTDHPRFMIKSGRAFAFPVYKSTFERDDEFIYPLQDESNSYKEHVIQWAKDLGRSVDYLETRSDIDRDKLAYFGHSWGGRMGAIMLAGESRFKAGVLLVAGFSSVPTQPEVDPFHFAGRVTVPVLMLSGRYDHIYPLETAALPFFERLGTPAEHKRHVISDGGHFVPRHQLIAETLAWLDRYLGSVRK